MKITIEPTTSDPAYNKVSIENANDDLKLDEVMGLIKAAVVAWGFSEETVKEYWG